MQCISLPSCHLRFHTPPKTSFKSACHVSPRMSFDDNSKTTTTISSNNNGLNLINNISKLLWGPSLPPGLLISTVRTAWTSTWKLMMSQLAPSDPSGGYTRPPSKFRLSRQFPTATKLHLYVGLPCPWAHRTLIVRSLKGLEEAIPVSIAAPGLDGSWEFGDFSFQDKSRDDGTLVPTRDKINGCRNLKEVYGLKKGGNNGRATVPMLWDVDQKEVICNESYDIIEFFNLGLNGLAQNPGLDLSPVELQGEIEEWNRVIYPNVNNGVYRCGFAQSQEAYDVAVSGLFNTLDKMDDHLGGSRYLCGDRLTLADICLFTTLIRFDVVYNVLFKCTKKKLLEFPNLHGYMRDIYQIPKVAATCNFPAIMDGYYRILFPLNPGSIRPVLPSGCDHESLSRPHDRESMSPEDQKVQCVA
ncbi:Ribosomal protein L14p/L23e family protein [Hibiscus syriacus]|uniref:Ribosomal protein L14p/L23e family protein n=1 Tax=Hibiscus syriacus TaxID=106335 RepID=A0A6A2WUL3_HIBSY|nr:glutathionyl-hydroquinone reductase YqjG-like [Hibiscus syriacus]KAE8664858.1 Ribosomal protein L14p/L23e family protein [Hibiscus syriacus]